MAKAGPAEYIRQVRSEMAKITWPTKEQTRNSAIAVFIMVTIASIFLYFADQVMAFAVREILDLGTLL